MGTKARDFSRVGGVGSGGGNLTLADIIPYLNTANVVEANNLYFTVERVEDVIAATSLDDLDDVNTTDFPPANGYALIWQGNTWVANAVVASLEGLTTDDLPEGISNLYYTDDRARAAIGAANPTIIYDVNTGLISANVSAIAESANTTDGVSEGYVNLYYTNARVHANIQAASLLDLRDVSNAEPANNTVLTYYNGLWSAGEYRPINSENADFANLVQSLDNFTTSNLAEGDNLYYTNARVEAHVATLSLNTLSDVYVNPSNLFLGRVLAWTGGQWEPVDSANISGVASSSFAESANVANVALFAERANVANSAGYADVAGSVLGGIADAENANVANIALYAYGAGIADVANVANVAWYAYGAGIADTANTVLFTERANVANIAIYAVLAETANLVNFALLADFANTAEFVESLDGLNTDDLAQGNVNRYYTDALVYANVSLMKLDTLADVNVGELTAANRGSLLFYDGTEWIANDEVLTAIISLQTERANVANTVLSFDGLSTANLAEGGSNIYFSNDRVRATIVEAIEGKEVNVSAITVYTYANVQGTLAVGQDLFVSGDSYLDGNLQVSQNATFGGNLFETAAKTLTISKGQPSQGSRIAFGEAAHITFNEAPARTEFGQIEIDVGFQANGNIIPAVSGRYNLGAPDRQWRSLYIGASTIFMGNLIITEGPPPEGGLQVIDSRTGEPAKVTLSNVAALQYVTVDRTSNVDGTIEEIPAFFIGNTLQYVSGTTGNIYYGIAEGGDYIDAFSGVRVQQALNGGTTKTRIGISSKGSGGTVENIIIDETALKLDGSTIEANVNGEFTSLPQIAKDALEVRAGNVILEYSNTTPESNFLYNDGIFQLSSDGVYEYTIILSITPEWQNVTSLNGAFMPTGTYIVQIYANDSAVGGGHVAEFYSGLMSWYSDDTNSTEFDELSLHRAGAGPGSGALFLRILRTSTSGTDDLILQIAGTTTNINTSSYTFKFRRLL